MSKFKVNSKSMQTSATYTDGVYKVDVNYTQDGTNGTMNSISGNIYKDESMSYAGAFNGSLNGENEISYSFSGIKAADMNAITTMVLDIEKEIKSEQTK